MNLEVQMKLKKLALAASAALAISVFAVGCGGKKMINSSHIIGAVCGGVLGIFYF